MLTGEGGYVHSQGDLQWWIPSGQVFHSPDHFFLPLRSRDPFGNESVAEIGYKWGFSGQAQFSRAFRAQFGVPPRDYREQALMKRAAAV